MIARLRKITYLISALAVTWFFLFPDPNVAVIGALLLQTLAYVAIAGKSTADGIVLTGITFILVGSLPGDHPIIRGSFYNDIKLWVVVTGVVLVLLGLSLVIKQVMRGN